MASNSSDSSPTLLPFNTMIHMVTIKLASSNYLLWKSQLLPLLDSQGLLGHVDGTLIPPLPFDPPTSQTPNSNHLAWKATNQRLLSLLLSSLTEEAMAEAVGLSTSHEVWTALESTFSHRSKAREIRLKDDLQLMKRGTHPVTAYARAFKVLCDQLHAIGRPIDETDKVHWFLCGLRPDFSTFSTAHMAQTLLLCFSDLISKAESSFRPNRGRGYGSNSNSSHSGQSRTHTNQGRRPPCCQICRLEGHYVDRWNGASLPITHTSNISHSPDLKLLDVLVVPHLTKNLLSISKLKNDFPLSVTFSNNFFTVQNCLTRKVVATGRRDGVLYMDNSIASFSPQRSNPSSTSLAPTKLAPPLPVDASHISSHPMLTRAKAGIFKTRHPANLAFLGSSSLLSAFLASMEPKGFKYAAKNPY
ncbi:hypothetical protein POTOM_053668 [Populus tomentosa]|uniref:Retrotransposon Copia-like N-terminal domain-containing protein n=1 Tax=Populus tomentosa TaxID=118781 RepID=A0A8X8C7S2_POPTO|nr:hypothetical protein POTOM_053668 [Populus tomentosa]